jgi:hypothetical protein
MSTTKPTQLTKSALILSTHPYRKGLDEPHEVFKQRVTASLLLVQERINKETGELWSDDPAEQWIREDTAVKAFKRWGSNPLGLPNRFNQASPNPYFDIYRALYADLQTSPLILAKRQRDGLLRSVESGHSRMTREEVLAAMPAGGTPEQRQAQAVWQMWQDDHLLYSPYNIYKLLKTTLGYAKWKANHNLPDLMTYRQTVWLLKTACASEHFKFKLGMRAHAKTLCSEKYTGHLFEVGEKGAGVKTKVGKVYGTWRLLSLLSEDEVTSNNANVYYKAKCEVCNTEFPKFNYRHMSKPCPECAKASRISVSTKKVVRLRNPISIYLMPSGQILLSGKRPEDATAMMTFTEADQEAGWVYFEDREKASEVRSLVKHNPQDFTLDPDKLLKKEDLYGFD